MEVTNYNFTLEELADVHTLNPDPLSKNRSVSRGGGTKCADKSPAINHTFCEKITTKYAELNSSVLIKNPNAVVPYVFGNGKTICIKARRNCYNKYKNFSFSDDDMLADYIAIYIYDEKTREGSYYLTNMKHVKNAEKKHKGGYVLVKENNIIDNSRIKVTISF